MLHIEGVERQNPGSLHVAITTEPMPLRCAGEISGNDLLATGSRVMRCDDDGPPPTKSQRITMTRNFGCDGTSATLNAGTAFT